MKKLLEIFGLGALMVIASYYVRTDMNHFISDYSIYSIASSIASFVFYSGVVVLIWGELLFVWKFIQKCLKGFKELKIFINNRDQ